VKVTRAGLSARVRHGFMAPQRIGTSTAPAPEPEPVVPSVPPVPSVPSEPRTEPAEPMEPAEPVVPSVPSVPSAPTVRSDALVRIGELSAGADATGRDTGAEGLQAYQRGDIEGALPLLQRAAARAGAPAWVHYALGFSYIGVNKPKDAIASWERVVESAPEFTPVYFDLATTYAQLKDYNGALSVLRTAARRWPADPEVHNGMGVVLTRRGDLDGAVDAFERAVKAAPRDPVSLLNLGRAYELRYMRDRRWIAAQKRWIGPEEDRAQAKANYERCAALGGPYGEQAKEALQRLAWSDKSDE
jgi:tetratricopeptide (TPR) repeat protein